MKYLIYILLEMWPTLDKRRREVVSEIIRAVIQQYDSPSS